MNVRVKNNIARKTLHDRNMIVRGAQMHNNHELSSFTFPQPGSDDCEQDMGLIVSRLWRRRRSSTGPRC